VDIAAWAAAAMGANTSGVVRLKGDSCVSLKSGAVLAARGSALFVPY